jgi:broad specificity phosphatase PhoE
VNRLILARHAETELNVGDVLNGDAPLDLGLTVRGREQAIELLDAWARERAWA